MTIKELAEYGKFRAINMGDNPEWKITKPFCCDLLSIAVGKVLKGDTWATVMGSIDTPAVASLTDVACVVMAEGVVLDEMTTEKAKQQEITMLATEEPISGTAPAIHEVIHGQIIL